MRRSVLVLALLALLGAGCSDDPGPLDRPAPTPAPSSATTEATPTETPSEAPVATCFNEEAVVSNGQSAGELSGDVDGDGTVEDVSIRFDPGAKPDCRAFVVVSDDEGDVAFPIVGFNAEFGLPQPSLNGLAQIDGEAGAEILVDLAAGASTQFVGAFSLRDGRGVMLRPSKGRSPWGEDLYLFPYGGSVGHLDAVDCSPKPEADVVMTSAIPKGRAYLIERNFYVVAPDGEMTLDPSLTDRFKVAFRDFNTDGLFDRGPFGSCPA